MSDKCGCNANLYAEVPILQDTKSEYDKQMDRVYKTWAQAQDTGPMPCPATPSINSSVPVIPCRFMPLSRAYQFSGVGPTPVNRQTGYQL